MGLSCFNVTIIVHIECNRNIVCLSIHRSPLLGHNSAQEEESTRLEKCEAGATSTAASEDGESRPVSTGEGTIGSTGEVLYCNHKNNNP